MESTTTATGVEVVPTDLPVCLRVVRRSMRGISLREQVTIFALEVSDMQMDSSWRELESRSITTCGDINRDLGKAKQALLFLKNAGAQFLRTHPLYLAALKAQSASAIASLDTALLAERPSDLSRPSPTAIAEAAPASSTPAPASAATSTDAPLKAAASSSTPSKALSALLSDLSRNSAPTRKELRPDILATNRNFRSLLDAAHSSFRAQPAASAPAASLPLSTLLADSEEVEAEPAALLTTPSPKPSAPMRAFSAASTDPLANRALDFLHSLNSARP